MSVEMKLDKVMIAPETKIPCVILKNKDTVLPIWIGIAEATSILAKLDNAEIARPLSHDLMKNILDVLAVRVKKVEVTDIKENTYYSLIYFEKDGKEITIDARPSDAIALAVRVNVPIMVSDEVIKKTKEEIPTNLRNMSKEDVYKEILEQMDPQDFKYKM